MNTKTHDDITGAKRLKEIESVSFNTSEGTLTSLFLVSDEE